MILKAPEGNLFIKMDEFTQAVDFISQQDGKNTNTRSVSQTGLGAFMIYARWCSK